MENEMETTRSRLSVGVTWGLYNGILSLANTLNYVPGHLLHIHSIRYSALQSVKEKGEHSRAFATGLVL